MSLPVVRFSDGVADAAHAAFVVKTPRGTFSVRIRHPAGGFVLAGHHDRQDEANQMADTLNDVIGTWAGLDHDDV